MLNLTTTVGQLQREVTKLPFIYTHLVEFTQINGHLKLCITKTFPVTQPHLIKHVIQATQQYLNFSEVQQPPGSEAV